MKTYTFPEYGITVTVDGQAGTIESKLKEQMFGDGDPRPCDFEINGAIDAIESMILGHACAGIDVASPAYAEGLRSSLEAITNHYA
jgi:hypothetical protein